MNEIEEHRIYLASDGKEGKPLKVYAREFFHEDFSVKNFTGARFNDCMFDHVKSGICCSAFFADCTFRNVDFSGSSIIRGNFRNCVFEKCCFIGSDLTEASFVNCKFLTTDLTDAELTGTDMIIVKFTNCRLKCEISDAKMYEVTIKSSFPEE